MLLTLLAIALPASANVPAYRKPLPQPQPTFAERKVANSGGRWYMAQDGHAVYCYGPTRMIPAPDGGFQKIVTFCRGDKVIVTLHE
jgi:hypothetical protein